MRYAGIGSRRLSEAELEICRKIGAWMARQGWILTTGAAVGADQAFADGALSVGGKVQLYVPWDSYESEWAMAAVEAGARRAVLEQHPKCDAALESVEKFHPNVAALKRGGVMLHARNWLILQNCKLVIAWPKGQGGTSQGLRIAEHYNIPIVDLDIQRNVQLLEILAENFGLAKTG